MKPLSTSDLARAVGAHPNTVRRYAASGLIPPVERAPNGYRRFTPHHLDCLRIARVVYSLTYPGKAIRQSASRIIPHAVAADWGGALEAAYTHLTFVQAERAQAEAAVRLLERWAAGWAADTTQQPQRIGAAARLLGVTVDMLRNWERNGLITIPRQASNRYRQYTAAEISRLRVIRVLARAGYSQMAILRMLLQLDRGDTTNLRQSLDTPAPDDDLQSAADRWLTTLTDQEQVALRLIDLVEDIIHQRRTR